MPLELTARVPADGTVNLEWNPLNAKPLQRAWVLAVRTGTRPGFTSVLLDGNTRRWELQNLGRHQRYRFMVMGRAHGELQCSAWLNVTPRHGLAPEPEEDLAGPQAHMAAVHGLLVMPQDRRLTAYWKLTPGFCDRVQLRLCRGGNPLHLWEVEPEVRSFTVDQVRAPDLLNGEAYTVDVRPLLAGLQGDAHAVEATPAAQGQERDANRSHPQAALVYPCLALTPEVDVFGDSPVVAPEAQIRCGHCGAQTHWKDYALRCTACQAEFISNGRGAFLDVTRLRFGTCRCCLPRKLLVQDMGSPKLRCAHAGKEHIRVPGHEGFLLTEELPFGLCQCCRPRRPLEKSGRDAQVRCSQSGELHTRDSADAGAFVLVPTAPVFDAAAIDDLLDAGMADICATGVTRGARR